MPQSVQKPSPVQERAPLVTIGIPAYNRPSELERAARSALAQDYPSIEVVVSDDASPNGEVERVAMRLAAADARLRFVRQRRNLGHAGNYQWVLEHAHGEYFMWLSDDDWIDPAYVERCLEALRADPTAVLVCGLGRYYRNGAHMLDERPIDLGSGRPGVRVIRYFARVSLNGPLFGVARRTELLRLGFPQVVGGDWLLVAALAVSGRVRTLEEVHVHRSLDGMGADPEGLARSFGLTGVAARRHHAVVAARVWKAICSGQPRFDSMGPITRIWAATAAAALILARFTLVDLVRRILGARTADAIERRISRWLRARDAR